VPKQRLALIGIILTAAYLRFFNLGSPKELVFDEVYYVNGAQDYLRDGVETAAGKAEFVVHPPIGKWMIALGIKVFGDNPFGWRFSAALVGTLSIFLIYLVARKLFHSEKFGLIAAALMSLDGLHLVMSRTALLDIFLMFFILLSFLALLYDRHWLAALSLGLALGTKWSALYFIAAIMIYYLVKNRKIPFQYIISIPIVYITSWFGWFASDKGWSRNFSTNPIISWLHYHREILNFHTGLTTQHSYQANPWNWLILGRPTSFFYSTPKDCGASSCSREVLAMGTPLLWWLATICIFVTVGYYIYQREKSALLILIGLGANYLPWFFFQKRTMFYFYSIAFEPFLILCVVYVMSKARERNRLMYSSIALIALVFLYFLPLFMGLTLPYDSWYDRMWLPSWI
jgi:dolichyl-phosphate-mannose-protein mannosyltransferase